jgi:septal ring factor EnvC (AmiA/AmiB activator)
MNLIKKYYKEILRVITIGDVIFLLVKILTQAHDKSELLKYKLEQLNQNINKMKQLQLQLNDSISSYKKDIDKIDENISKIKSEKTTINNFYEQKKEKIEGMSKKEIDSSFKQRYKY